MKNNIKDKNLGITLVALVMTIVLLLILAGLTISTLTGSGLFRKAELSKEKTETLKREEEETLNKYENEVEKYIDGNRENIDISWKKLISETGHISDETAINLPDTYSELLIEIGKENMENDAYFYTINICKDMLLDNNYKIYSQGYGFPDYMIGVSVKAKKDRIYLHNYLHYNNDYKSQATMTVYYR